MAADEFHGANRWKRFSDWDERALRLDNFAVEDPENGFAAFHGATDPVPGLTIAVPLPATASTTDGSTTEISRQTVAIRKRGVKFGTC